MYVVSIFPLIFFKEKNDLVEVICTSIAAGTFLYISCSKIIIEEFSLKEHWGLHFGKLFAFLAGAGVIGITFYVKSIL